MMKGWKLPIFASTLMAIGFVCYLVLLPEYYNSKEGQDNTSSVQYEPAKAVRDVTTNNLLKAPEVETGFLLERLPARKPPPPPPKPPKPEKVKRPVILSAGIIKLGEKTLKLADIDPLPLDQKCKSDTDTDWPCGMFARTEMRQFFRGRPIECEPGNEKDQTIVTRCRLEHFDISAWLVLTGWALPIGDHFSEELVEAQNHQRGMWRKSAP